MADASEDTLHNPTEEVDPTDEVVDFRFLTAQKLPSRGIKDFEPHGTKLQQSTLDTSRQAMYDVLSQTRIHSQNVQHAVWDPESGGAWVTKPGGRWTTSVGQSKRTTNNKSRLWLLPEEALWLIDRGSLDIRWPAGPGEESDDGIPMSLQGAYAAFIRQEQSYPLSLEMYSVYAYLKRAGYIVLRADANQHNVPKSQETRPEVSNFLPEFRQLWNKIFTVSDQSRRAAFGPLLRPGIYRDYGTYIEKNWLVLPISLSPSIFSA
jgi:tRNA-splicing endonuclease subunit Sen54